MWQNPSRISRFTGEVVILFLSMPYPNNLLQTFLEGTTYPVFAVNIPVIGLTLPINNLSLQTFVFFTPHYEVNLQHFEDPGGLRIAAYHQYGVGSLTAVSTTKRVHSSRSRK